MTNIYSKSTFTFSPFCDIICMVLPCNGRRLPLLVYYLLEGLQPSKKRNPCTLHAGKFLIKEGDAMSVLEVLALLGYGLACVKFGYIMGINAKK